jgi:hypothetical protein
MHGLLPGVWHLYSVDAAEKHTAVCLVFHRNPHLQQRAVEKAQRKQTERVGDIKSSTNLTLAYSSGRAV